MKIFNDVHYGLARGLCDDPLSIENYEKVEQVPRSIGFLKDAGFIVFPLENRYSGGLIETAIEAMRQSGFDASEEDARHVIGSLTGWVIDHWYSDYLAPPDID